MRQQSTPAVLPPKYFPWESCNESLANFWCIASSRIWEIPQMHQAIVFAPSYFPLESHQGCSPIKFGGNSQGFCPYLTNKNIGSFCASSMGLFRKTLGLEMGCSQPLFGTFPKFSVLFWDHPPTKSWQIISFQTQKYLQEKFMQTNLENNYTFSYSFLWMHILNTMVNADLPN